MDAIRKAWYDLWERWSLSCVLRWLSLVYTHVVREGLWMVVLFLLRPTNYQSVAKLCLQYFVLHWKLQWMAKNLAQRIWWIMKSILPVILDFSLLVPVLECVSQMAAGLEKFHTAKVLPYYFLARAQKHPIYLSEQISTCVTSRMPS